MIMNYAIEYNPVPVTLRRIDQVRLYKGFMLPIEIIGVHRKTFTTCAYNKHKHSLIEWEFKSCQYTLP